MEQELLSLIDNQLLSSRSSLRPDFVTEIYTPQIVLI